MDVRARANRQGMLDSRVLSTRAGAWERACLAGAVNLAAPNPLPFVPARLLGSGFEFR